MTKVRYGVPGDLEAIARLEAVSYPEAESASLESIRGRMAAFPSHFWLLEEDGELVSFINGMVTDLADLSDEMYDDPTLHNEAGAWQMIFSVVTTPEQRGRGLAGTVMERVIADARTQKRLGVVLTCKERLIPFYGKFGFVDEGVSQSTHGDVVWHQMRLRF